MKIVSLKTTTLFYTKELNFSDKLAALVDPQGTKKKKKLVV